MADLIHPAYPLMHATNDLQSYFVPQYLIDGILFNIFEYQMLSHGFEYSAEI